MPIPDGSSDQTTPIGMKVLLQRSGMTRQTVHFYLRKGLLPKPARTSRTYAVYPPETVDLLAIVKECQTVLRLSLDEITDLFLREKYDTGRIRGELEARKLTASPALNATAAEPRSLKSDELLARLQPQPPSGWIDELRQCGLLRAEGDRFSPETAELIGAIWNLSKLGIKSDRLKHIARRIDEEAEAELTELRRTIHQAGYNKDYEGAIRLLEAFDRFVGLCRKDAIGSRFIETSFRSADIFVGPNQKHVFPSETFLAKMGLNKHIDRLLNQLDSDPDNRRALIDLARAYYLRSDWLNLYGVSEKILELDPMSTRAIADKTRAMTYLGRLDDSVRLLERRLRLASDPLLKFRLGQCLLLQAKNAGVPALLHAVVKKRQLATEALRETREPAIRRWILLDMALDNLSVSDPLQLNQPAIAELEQLHREYESIPAKNLAPLSKISLMMGRMLAGYALYLVYRRHRHPKAEQLRRKIIQMDPHGVLATRAAPISDRTRASGRK